MRMIRTSALLALLAIPAFAQQPVPPVVPMPMPQVAPAPKPVKSFENPNKQIYGTWEMTQYFRVDPHANPIAKGVVQFRDDNTFTWATAQGDKIEGKYQIHNDKIMCTTVTPFGKVTRYNFTDLEMIDGKIIRPISVTSYEVWDRDPPKKAEKPVEKKEEKKEEKK